MFHRSPSFTRSTLSPKGIGVPSVPVRLKCPVLRIRPSQIPSTHSRVSSRVCWGATRSYRGRLGCTGEGRRVPRVWDGGRRPGLGCEEPGVERCFCRNSGGPRSGPTRDRGLCRARDRCGRTEPGDPCRGSSERESVLAGGRRDLRSSPVGPTPPPPSGAPLLRGSTRPNKPPVTVYVHPPRTLHTRLCIRPPA